MFKAFSNPLYMFYSSQCTISCLSRMNNLYLVSCIACLVASFIAPLDSSMTPIKYCEMGIILIGRYLFPNGVRIVGRWCSTPCRVVPDPDGTIYLVDINKTHYWGSFCGTCIGVKNTLLNKLKDTNTCNRKWCMY